MAVKRVVIIGATSGIGLEVAKGYLKAGWQVGIAGRREEELEKLLLTACLLYTSPSPRDVEESRMPSSA